ncbi:MAG: MATE family efflux transporter [Planctomycetes bacterium]|nr:MATE family efflux transporter [Planctomycetota bacterium]
MATADKSLTALAMPLVASFTFRFLFTLVDLIYAAQIKEQVPYGVAAIGLFIPLQSLFIAIWVGLSAGFTATISQAFGRRDQARVTALKRAMAWLLVALVPLMQVFAAWVWYDAQHLDIQPELRRDYLTYALILVCSMPFSGFLSIYPDSIVKAHHDTVTTMKAGLLSTVTNLLLNTVFVFTFDWGIAGIAWATVLSRYAGFGYAAARTRTLERIRLAEWTPTPHAWVRTPLADILALAVPGGMAFGLVFLEEWVIRKLLTTQPQPHLLLASYAVYGRFAALATMPAIATAVAVLPYAARRVAEGRNAEVRAQLLHTTLRIALLVLAIGISIGWLFARPLVTTLALKQTETAGTAVETYLTLVPFAALATLPFLILRPVFEAVGQPRIGAVVAMVKSLLLVIPLTVLGCTLAPALATDPLFSLLVGNILALAAVSTLVVLLCRRLLTDAPATGAGSHPSGTDEGVRPRGVAQGPAAPPSGGATPDPDGS